MLRNLFTRINLTDDPIGGFRHAGNAFFYPENRILIETKMNSVIKLRRFSAVRPAAFRRNRCREFLERSPHGLRVKRMHIGALDVLTRCLAEFKPETIVLESGKQF